MQKKFAVQSLGHAVLVLAYVSLIVFLINNAQAWFGDQKTVLIPMAMLMLFVLSAAITGALVLARPAMMYLNGEKKEAVKFFGYTVAWMFVLTVLVFVVLAVKK